MELTHLGFDGRRTIVLTIMGGLLRCSGKFIWTTAVRAVPVDNAAGNMVNPGDFFNTARENYFA